jgi:hypothetical protein
MGGGVAGIWLDIQGKAGGPPGLPQGSLPVYVARNGTYAENVARVFAMAGGIQAYIDADDIVLLKPNGQWPRQGYTHTGCLKALIDLILERPGGFSGEILIIEHVQRNASDTLATHYCWNMSPSNRLNNWPDMNYIELVQDYHNRGRMNVSAIPLLNSFDGDFVRSEGPESLPPGKHGWVTTTYLVGANNRTAYLPYALLRSPFSGKIIDTKHGVWQNGGYTSQKVKLAFLPTLNNHGSYRSEDYAGPTSAVKCHLGVVAFNGPSGTSNLHNIGYSSNASQNRPDAVGEAIGHLITSVIHPVFYMTCAEYTGQWGRTSSSAAHTQTVGLCADPVTLDYWMCKYVLLPADPVQTFMNPDLDNNLRRTLLGCQSKGVGTLDENRIVLHVDDHSPVLRLTRKQLHFGAQGGLHTQNQSLGIRNDGPGVLNWTAQTAQSWITLSPGSGTGDGTVVIGVKTTGLGPGTYNGTVTVSASGAFQSPQTVAVTLKIFAPGEIDRPFGVFDIPFNNSWNLSGAIPISGWVLDGLEVENVRIYYEDPNQKTVFVADAVFVDGARPDIESLYPDHPLNHRAGWGYMLLTNMLPEGDGVYKLHAVARDIEGHETHLGTKTISVNNAASLKPFGTIDTPTQGQTVSGTDFINFGWVLTPLPKFIPYDGSTIGVFINGLFVAQVSYNHFRPDIANLFPGYANSDGAVGFLSMNTHLYANGVHTIAWGVTDSAGAVEGIGSRYFTIDNPSGAQASLNKDLCGMGPVSVKKIEGLLEDRRRILYRKGFDTRRPLIEAEKDETGIPVIRAMPGDRIEVVFERIGSQETGGHRRIPERVYLATGRELRPPPIGSSLLDGEGRFVWHPGPGFLGRYDFVSAGEKSRTRFSVELQPPARD